MRTRAVLFDLDGTLVDSYPAITASVNHVRRLHDLPPLDVAEVIPHVGRGPTHLIRQTVGEHDVESVLAAYRDHHPSILHQLTRLLPGAHDTLDALHRAGHKLGICSNKPVAFTRELIDYFSLGGLFDVVLGPEDVGRIKPAPDILLCALSRLGLSPSEVLYVGDMTVDIETARAAGVPVWVVATGSDTAETLDAARPDRRLARLDEIPALLA